MSINIFEYEVTNDFGMNVLSVRCNAGWADIFDYEDGTHFVEVHVHDAVCDCCAEDMDILEYLDASTVAEHKINDVVAAVDDIELFFLRHMFSMERVQESLGE